MTVGCDWPLHTTCRGYLDFSVVLSRYCMLGEMALVGCFLVYMKSTFGFTDKGTVSLYYVDGSVLGCIYILHHSALFRTA